MDIRHFRTFKSIIEEGNFSNAAIKLGYTQSTVTSQIQQLEQELSIKLFEKIGRNMVLTTSGKELIPYANELLDIVKKIESIGKSGDNITGELTIAVAESLMSYKLQNVLSLFKEKAPNVKLSIISMNCFAIKNILSKGEIDLGLMYDVGNQNDSLITVKLADFNLANIFKGNSKWVPLVFYIALPGIMASIIPITKAASIAPRIEALILGTKNWLT